MSVAAAPRRPADVFHAVNAPLTDARGHGTVVWVLGRGIMSARAACFVLAALLAFLGVSQARAASLFEKNFWMRGPRYDRAVPACDYPAALDKIIWNFHQKEDRFWLSDLKIVGIEDIQENAFMPWAAQSIPRRYCQGTALINDGARHAIYYSIAEDTGMIGMSWGVNFCVVDLDRNWAYNPRCRMARP
jgi:hypothetical protein